MLSTILFFDLFMQVFLEGYLPCCIFVQVETFYFFLLEFDSSIDIDDHCYRFKTLTKNRLNRGSSYMQNACTYNRGTLSNDLC